MATTAPAVTSTAVAAGTPGHRQDDQPAEEGQAEEDRRDPHVFTRPKRRSRRWYSATASKSCSRRKSGHSTSVNTSSE